MILPLLISLFIHQAHAAFTDPPSEMKLEFSAGKKSVQVLGRVMPELGALQVERAKHQGRVLAVLVHEGDQVKPGEALMRITGGNCAAHGDNCLYHAIHHGVVNEILKTAGQDFEDGDGLLNILNPTGVSIRLDVPAKLIKFVSINQILKIHGTKGGDSLEARVSEIAPTIGTDISRGVRLALSSPPPGTRLESLINADIPIPLGEDGSRVPSEAVAFFGGKQYVIKKTAEGREAAQVQILSETGDSLYISPAAGTDLKTGDTIYASKAIYYLNQIMNERAD